VETSAEPGVRSDPLISALDCRALSRGLSRGGTPRIVGQLTGIEVRHAKGCATSDGRRCNCRPTYQASAWSARDAKRLRKTFPTLAAARAWRSEAQTAIRRGRLRAPAGTTLREAAEELVDGTRSGKVRTRSGDLYKPSAVRSYEAALRDRVLPTLGAKR